MQLPFLTHQRLASRLEDVASALDAGLPADAILAGVTTAGWEGPATGSLDRGLATALVERGATLSAPEQRVLEVAEAAGDLPRALRSVAAARRNRGELQRELLGQLLYPIFLLAVALALFGTLALVGRGQGSLVLLPPLLLVGCLGLLALEVRRAWRSPVFARGRVPGLAALSHDAGVVPYLEALANLYGAGLPIVEAHESALRAVPVAWVRARLFRATEALKEGSTPLTQALAQTQALEPGTLALLRPGEHAGDLEQSLRRAAQRRRDTLGTRAKLAVRILGTSIYLFAVAFAAWHILSFYTDYYGRLTGRR